MIHVDAVIPWTPISVVVAALAFIVPSAFAGMKYYSAGQTARQQKDAKRIEEAKRQGAEEATGIDPKVLAREVAGLKKAVLGSEGDEFEGPSPGLKNKVAALEVGLRDNTTALGVLTNSVDELVVSVNNGNGK